MTRKTRILKSIHQPIISLREDSKKSKIYFRLKKRHKKQIKYSTEVVHCEQHDFRWLQSAIL